MPTVEIVRDCDIGDSTVGIGYEQPFQETEIDDPDNWNFDVYVATPFGGQLVFDDKLGAFLFIPFTFAHFKILFS